MAARFLYWFIIECENSWAFRAVILGMAIVILVTVFYTLCEFWRSIRPRPGMDQICSKAFLIWALCLEAFVTFAALLYLLGVRVVIV